MHGDLHPADAATCRAVTPSYEDGVLAHPIMADPTSKTTHLHATCRDEFNWDTEQLTTSDSTRSVSAASETKHTNTEDVIIGRPSLTRTKPRRNGLVTPSAAASSSGKDEQELVAAGRDVLGPTPGVVSTSAPLVQAEPMYKIVAGRWR